jgi:hypothetical protein
MMTLDSSRAISKSVTLLQLKINRIIPVRKYGRWFLELKDFFLFYL